METRSKWLKPTPLSERQHLRFSSGAGVWALSVRRIDFFGIWEAVSCMFMHSFVNIYRYL